MSLFKKNPNEVNYVGGQKHWTDVIKNSSNGNELLWLNPEEDFNTNSTVIVAESEKALFFKDGNKFVSREILTNLSQNDGAGLAVMGASLGLGVNAGNQFAGMTSQIFGQQSNNTSSNGIVCSKCNNQNTPGARFCSSCGNKL